MMSNEKTMNSNSRTQEQCQLTVLPIFSLSGFQVLPPSSTLPSRPMARLEQDRRVREGAKATAEPMSRVEVASFIALPVVYSDSK